MAGHIIFPDVPPDKLYATMVHQLLPVGLKGLVVAGLLAALMSSLSSVFNSASTLVVMDFYRVWKPEAKDQELVRVGQYSTLALVAVGLAWLPFLELMSEQLYVYLQSVQAYISPPIATVFLLGVLWRGANANGARVTLLVGFLVGALRFVSEVGVKAKWVTHPWLVSLVQVNFLHFAVALALLSVALLVSVSKLTGGATEEQLRIFDRSKEVPQDPSKRKLKIGLSVLLVGIVLVLWMVFSPLVF
jgi:SSS family solute:Na+ symporter